MANGISRLQLLINLNNRLGAGLNAARQQVERATGGMQGRLDAFSARNVQAFGALRDEVPGVGRAFELIGNPIVAAGAGIAALGFGIIKATDEAARFSGHRPCVGCVRQDRRLLGAVPEAVGYGCGSCYHPRGGWPSHGF